jgi:hypothetical protein
VDPRDREPAPPEPRQRVVEPRALAERALGRRGVGRREVGEQPHHVHVPRREDRVDELLGAIPLHADATHPGVDLQVDARAAPERARDLVDLRQLHGRRRGHVERVLDEVLDLVPDDAAEHEDGRLDAVPPEPDALLEEGHAELLDAGREQRACGGEQPVPVGVGLHDGHDRPRTHASPHDADVMAERAEVDGGDGGSEGDVRRRVGPHRAARRYTTAAAATTARCALRRPVAGRTRDARGTAAPRSPVDPRAGVH